MGFYGLDVLFCYPARVVELFFSFRPTTKAFVFPLILFWALLDVGFDGFVHRGECEGRGFTVDVRLYCSKYDFVAG